MNTLYYRLSALIIFCVLAGAVWGVPEPRSRAYTAEHPLIYEGSWDLWPYSFLNEQGKPDGFSIELIKMMLDELGIPYTIKLKANQEAFNDLRDGKSDLRMGLASGLHDDYGHYSQNAVTLFTQSVAAPKSKPTTIHTLRDLAENKVLVYKNSLCHHLMKDYGWEENAIPHADISSIIQKVNDEEEGQIVWNTLSLKWLINKYQLDNLQLSPVDMPHGEYKFMSNDLQLLQQLDSLYTVLNSADKLTPIQNKWFYPERQQEAAPRWFWWLTGGLALLSALLFFYYLNYRIQERRVVRQATQRNNRLALILETCDVRLWTYDLATNVFTWRNENGQAAYTYTTDEFSHRYHPGDFQRLMEAINELARTDSEEQEKEVRLDVKARDTEDGDAEERNFTMVLSVLHRDKKGRPTTILGTKRDVTEKHQRQQLERERELRYWVIFNTPVAGVTYYNKEGILTDLNQKACDICQCNREEILAEQVTFHDMYGIGPEETIASIDGFYATGIIDIDKIQDSERRVRAAKRKGKLYQEVRLITVYDDDGVAAGLFGICRDITERLNSINQQAEVMERTKTVHMQLADYVHNINYTLSAGNVRMASYSPLKHALTIYSGINVVQHSLMQARCMTLIDDSSKKKAMRLFESMDNYTEQELDTDIRTNIRVKNREMMHLQLHLVPTRDRQGNITEYFGLCRDVTELKSTERQMRIQTARTQEVENAKNSFLKNVSYEIRTPLNAVVGFASLFEMDHSSEDEQIFVNEILDNSDKLLVLINNILFLSRIDAGMLEIDKKPCDFAAQFDADCEMGWEKMRKEGVKYIVENPYQKLVVNIDATNLAHIIHRVADNAARYTQQGTVRARYDYIGRTLRIAIDDTGQGIPQDKLAGIAGRFVTGSSNSSGGLGLPICKELTELMGGTFEISSEEGLGTTVWITIPCHASEIKRKRSI